MIRKWIQEYNFQYLVSFNKYLIPHLSEGENLKVIDLYLFEVLSETDFDHLLTLTKAHSLKISFTDVLR